MPPAGLPAARWRRRDDREGREEARRRPTGRYQMDFVSDIREPGGIRTGTTAYVQNHCRRVPEPATNHFLGTRKFKLRWPRFESRSLGRLLVVHQNFWRRLPLHRFDLRWCVNRTAVPVPVGRHAENVRSHWEAPKSTSLVSIVPALRPGAVWLFQYRFVCAMTLSGGGAPRVVLSSVVWASPTSVAS
jgi:hypothetical protein